MKTAKELVREIADMRERIECVDDCTPRMGHLLYLIQELLLQVSAPLRDLRDAQEGKGDDLVALNAVLRRRATRAERSMEFHLDWWAGREGRLRELLHDTPYWRDYAAILANGSAEPNESRSYVGHVNLLRHRIDKLEKSLASARSLWRQVQSGDERSAQATAILEALLKEEESNA